MFDILQFTLAVILAQFLSLQNLQTQAQKTNVVLNQGALLGLKVFPESSRTPVYAFLGIPYAESPIGELRFASPKPHGGWNWTLQAMSMKPICPQLTNTVYDETADGTPTRPAEISEDCLYLNIWVPESGIRFGNLPVLVILTGEEMSYDWPRNRPTGLDFASEGVVVVSVQYRSNIFGWINLGNHELAGNYGLQDQQLALKWIQQNIQHFGGIPSQVTLLGHGTSGAACAFGHYLTHITKEPLFSNLILMSAGDIEIALTRSATVLEASKTLIQKLSCQFEEGGQQIVLCLRMKSVSDLLKAFESLYDHGNGTLTLGPVLTTKFTELLREDNTRILPPMLIGITSNEGAFLQDYWLDLARDGYQTLRSYVNYTVLPHILRHINIQTTSNQIMDALNWRYFSGEAAVSVVHLLNGMQRLISESYYETPFYRLLELFSGMWNNTNSNSRNMNMYAYIFETSNALDMRGKVNYFGGGSHSADIPLLLGPSLFQQISRRRFTADEDKLCRKLRTAFVNFVKSGNPTPGRLYDAWLPYGKEQKFIFNLGEMFSKDDEKAQSNSAFEGNLPLIEKMLERDKNSGNGIGLSRPNRNEYNNPYQQAGDRTLLEGRRTKSESYLQNHQDSGYALHLKRVYGFWQVFLPNMAVYGGDGDYEGINDELNQRVRLMEASADAARYRQGFFAMLGLVAILLAILGLCVYLLRRDPLRISSSPTSWLCL